MKAIAVYPKERRVALIENHPEPQITSPTQVKLQILEVGVCGTDRDICQFVYGTPPPGSDYLVIGHECLARVVAVGAEVTQFKIGDLVVPQVRRPCDHPDCAACRAGRQDFCYSGDYKERGIKHLHGFMTEYIVDEERYLLPVPQDLRPLAVLTEPLTVVEKAVDQISHIQSRFSWVAHKDGHRYTAVVLGAGPVGLLGAMVLARDYNTVVYSREIETSEHAKIAKSIGARYVSSAVTLPPQLAEDLKNIDMVLEATGVPSISFQLLDVLGINGIFAFAGIPRNADILPEALGTLMRNIVLKNQAVVGSVNAAKENFKSAIQHLDQFKLAWPAMMDSLIVRFPMEAYESLLMQTNANFKNVLKIAE